MNSESCIPDHCKSTRQWGATIYTSTDSHDTIYASTDSHDTLYASTDSHDTIYASTDSHDTGSQK